MLATNQEVIHEFFTNITTHVQSIEEGNFSHPFLSDCFQKNNFNELHNVWLHYFNYYKTEASKIGNNSNIHSMLVFIMMGTLTTLVNQRYKNSLGHMVELRSYEIDNNVYDDESEIEIGTDIKLPFESTRVILSNEDCMVIAQNLVNSGSKNVMVLNMASKTSPNGGWKFGHWAQEESMTRRGNYKEFLHDNLKRLYANKGVPTYGGIFSKKVCFFRGKESDGYPYLDSPFMVDCLAVAAFNLRAKKSKPEYYEFKTERKMRAIFKIAFKEKCRTLILGAIGCGAFQNKANFISQIYFKLIKKYAGCFESIIFSVLDDSKMGNPNGNFSEFQRFFDDSKFTQVFPMKLCKNGAKCREYNDFDHESKYNHPEKCINFPCPERKNQKHMEMFWHPETDKEMLYMNDNVTKCKYGTECKEIQDRHHLKKFSHPSYCKYGTDCRDYHANEKHRKEYFHPDECEYKGICTEDYEPDHCKIYIHPQICKYGSKCNELTSEHMLEYRHPKIPCKYGLNCYLEPDRKQYIYHRKFFSHQYLPICKYEPICKKRSNVKHLEKYSHLCSWGSSCREFTSKKKNESDEQHCKLNIHFKKLECKYGENCKDIDDNEHMEVYSHPGHPMFKVKCKNWDECNDYEDGHRKRFLHREERDITFDVFGLNKKVDFLANKMRIEEAVDNYLKSNNVKINLDGPKLVRSMHPMHRCKIEIFKEMIKHGILLSNFMQENFQVNQVESIWSEFIANKEVGKLLYAHNINKTTILREWLRAKVHVYALENKITLKKAYKSLREYQKAQKKHKDTLNSIYFKNIDDMKTLEILAERVIENVFSHQSSGIKYVKDKDIGTNNHVFSIIGWNNGTYYGPIILMLKKKVMYHPDFNMTAVAGTSFMSGNVNTLLPWVQPDQGVAEFNNYKMHPCIKGWDILAGKLMVCKTHFWLKSNQKAKNDITYDDVISFEKHNDAHHLFEGHLPSIIPLSYIKKIAIPKEEFSQLSEDEQNKLKYLINEGAKAQRIIIYKEKSPLYHMNKDAFDKTDKVNGVSFSLANKFGSEIKLPITFRTKSESLKIEFSVRGFDIHISLSNSFKSCFKSDKNVFHFVLNHKNSYNDKTLRGLSYITFTHEFSISKGNQNKILKSVKDLDDKKNPQTLALRRVDGFIKTLTNFIGLNTLEWNSKEKKDVFLTEIQYIYFSCWDSIIDVKDVRLL